MGVTSLFFCFFYGKQIPSSDQCMVCDKYNLVGMCTVSCGLCGMQQTCKYHLLGS